MPKRPELSERLQNLHEELENTNSVDGDARELLGELLDDIRSLIDRSSDSDTDHTPDSLSERLEAATREWETSHPTLAAAVGRVMDTLSNMGI
jgi:hypothetical protein